MTVTITSASTDFRLTTLSRVKDELSISSTSSDAYLSTLILEASDFITDYTNRDFAKQAYTESIGATGTPMMVLDRAPIVSISQIRYNGSTVSSTAYSISNANAGTIQKDDGWADSQIYHQNINAFPTGYAKKLWEIDYVAGYKLPNSTDTGTSAPALPYDIQRACVEIVKASYLRKGQDPMVKSQKTGDASETLFDGAFTSAIPPLATSILSGWIRYS